MASSLADEKLQDLREFWARALSDDSINSGDLKSFLTTCEEGVVLQNIVEYVARVRGIEIPSGSCSRRPSRFSHIARIMVTLGADDQILIRGSSIGTSPEQRTALALSLDWLRNKAFLSKGSERRFSGLGMCIVLLAVPYPCPA